MDERVALAIAEIADQRKALGIISTAAVVLKPAAGSPERAGGAGDSDAESDGEVATLPRAETDAAMADANASAPFDEDGPAWPSAADEAAFIGDEKSQGRTAPTAGVQTLRQEAAQAEAALGPLPGIDTLMARIPPETLAVVNDLLRVKFTGVRRVSPDSLK